MDFLRLAVCLLALAAFAGSSHALPIVDTAPCVNDSAANCAVGVRRLNVLGTLYDVTFSQDAFVDLVSATPHALLGDSGSAFLSTYVLAAPLNAMGSSISGIVGAPTGPPWSSLLIAFDYDDVDFFSWEILYRSSLIQFIPFTGYSITTSSQFSYHNPSHRTYTAYAIFTESVPVPGVLPLVCIGLLGVLGCRRQYTPTNRPPDYI